MIEQIFTKILENNEEQVSSKLNNNRKKTFCITGKLNKPRKKIVAEIEERQNWIFKPSITKNLDFLVIGENPGSKLQKAEKLEGIQIILLEDIFRK